MLMDPKACSSIVYTNFNTSIITSSLIILTPQQLHFFFLVHLAVKFALAHALHHCGVTASLPAVEEGVSGDGAEPHERDVGREPGWKADLAFFDQHSGVEYLVDVAIVNEDSHEH